MVRKKKAWGPSNALWRWQHGYPGGKPHKSHSGGKHMARRGRKYGRRRGGGGGGLGLGRILSMKNILFTVAGAYLAPKVAGISSNIGGAAGGYMGAGIPGAVAGYVAGPIVAGMLGGAAQGAAGGIEILG